MNLSGRRGHLLFGVWAIAGALLAFSVLAASSLGLLILPVAVAVVVVLFRRGPGVSPEILGSLAGAGGVSLVIAWLNHDSRPCAGSGTLGPSPIGAVESVGCGGFAPEPWFVAGLALVAAAWIGYGAARRRGLSSTA